MLTCPYCARPTVSAEGMVEHIKGHHRAPPAPQHFGTLDLHLSVGAHNSAELGRLLSAALAVHSPENQPAAPSASEEIGGRS